MTEKRNPGPENATKPSLPEVVLDKLYANVQYIAIIALMVLGKESFNLTPNQLTIVSLVTRVVFEVGVELLAISRGDNINRESLRTTFNDILVMAGAGLTYSLTESSLGVDPDLLSVQITTVILAPVVGKIVLEKLLSIGISTASAITESVKDTFRGIKSPKIEIPDLRTQLTELISNVLTLPSPTPALVGWRQGLEKTWENFADNIEVQNKGSKKNRLEQRIRDLEEKAKSAIATYKIAHENYFIRNNDRRSPLVQLTATLATYLDSLDLNLDEIQTAESFDYEKIMLLLLDYIQSQIDSGVAINDIVVENILVSAGKIEINKVLAMLGIPNIKELVELVKINRRIKILDSKLHQ